VEILVGTEALEPRAYLVTVSEQLERLGHGVHVFAAEEVVPPPDELRVVTTGRGLPLAPDVVYAQDAYAALLLADLYPLTPQLFALHGDWLPPQLAGVVARVAVFDERAAERARAAALPQELVRLRRPVDLERVAERGPLPGRPRSARVAPDGLSDYRRGLVQRACADAGIALEGEPDLVIGRGAAVLEAMAAGLPVYVYGDDGGDGWVTPERYELLEADGFSGRAEPGATSFDRLRAALEGYDPAMGPANRELAIAHDARRHAEELVAALLDAVQPRHSPVDAPLRELARLVRLEAAAARRAEAAKAEASAARGHLVQLERELAQSREGGGRLAARVAELEQELAAAEKRLEEAERHRGRGVRGLLGREGRVPSTEG
jgi:glycosyltransferase involved in cell wall biosynthesis